MLSLPAVSITPYTAGVDKSPVLPCSTYQATLLSTLIGTTSVGFDSFLPTTFHSLKNHSQTSR